MELRLITLVTRTPSSVFSCETRSLNEEGVVPDLVTTTTSVGSGVAVQVLVLFAVAVGLPMAVIVGEPILESPLTKAARAPTAKHQQVS